MKVTISPDFRDLLPEHSEEELKQLENNCLLDYQHESMPPVIVWANDHNTIIDGHHQYEIRTRLGLQIRYAALEFESRDEALRHALDIQFGRRNLSASQRAMAYAKLPRMSEGRPGENVANLQRLSDLADAAGVSKRMMSDATKVADEAVAAVVEGVRAGDFSASDAAAIVDLPEHEQIKIAEAAIRNDTTLKAAKISGGISFDPVELENAPARRPPRNGSSVMPGKERQVVLELLGKVVRGLKELDLFDEFNQCLSQVIRRVKELK